ncbi:MAG: histone-lysine N-methyltransferase, partial [Eggerthellaceae bacterium]|nr:histone-lysine N-methyltransferase [Eggerthellaceae bacterium]
MAKHANNLGYESDTSSEYPDALESLEPVAEGLMVDGEEDFDAESSDLESRGQHSAPVLAVAEEGSGKKKKKKKKEVPYYMRKSRRTRKILIVAIVLLILLIGALGYLSFQLVEESRRLADEHSQEQQSLEDVEKIEQDVPQDVVPEAAKKTSAPNLVQLMGLNLDE